MRKGRFITFEGIEGVGKSTNIDFLVGLIEDRGFSVLQTREPGGTSTAEDIRRILKEHGDEPMPSEAELLLMFAARSINVSNTIRPALESGTWVVSDRFTDSTRAYQGGGRGVAEESIEWLADFVHGGVQPDLTILLDAPVDTAMARAGRRGKPDRFEVERTDFFQRVRDTYLKLAASAPERFVVVDVSRDLDAVRADIRKVAEALFSENQD
jgi:dTMP kinase